MKRLWWVGLLLFLLAIVWAEAQEKPTLGPIQPIEPIPEKERGIDRGRFSPIEETTPTPESEKALDKPTFGPMPQTEPTPERDLNLRKLKLGEIAPGEILEEPMLQYIPTQLGQFSPIAVLQEDSPQHQSLALKEVSPVQGLDGISYQVREFSDFKGGLDLVSTKTKIAPNCAIELENALWNPQGEMYKRPGYSEHSTPPFTPNFLYRYYQQDRDEWTMGGSDTALYFWHEDSSGDGWTYLIGTEGTEGRWDGETYEDMFVGVHEGIVPVVWDGATLVDMGTSADSFRARETHSYTNTAGVCSTGSTWIKFDEADAAWTTDEWAGYILLFQARIDTAAGPIKDTVTQKAIILSNTANTMIIRHDTYRGIAGTVMPVTPDYTNNWYARIFSWFQVDTVWREGKVDTVKNPCSTAPFTTQIFDDSYAWDSTFSYNDYIFEVTSGTGDEKSVFLYDWNYGASSDCGQWNNSAFFVSTFSPTCFDTSTHYRIYKPSFWVGSKFVENFDGSLWLGWTGTGTEQNKNIVVWSELDDLGNWPPENHIIIESDDGDFITGMAKFPGEYTDVPRQEMIVTKNNSLYKIVPSGDSYAFWLIASGVGCVSNSAISPAEGLLLFPDQHGVWAYDQRKTFSISKLIKPIFEGWDLDNLEDVSAIYNPQDRHYYLSLPVDVDTAINANFIITFKRDSAGVKDQFIHLITTLGGEQDGDIQITDDTSSSYCDIASDTLGNYCVLVKNLYNLFLFMFDSLHAQVGTTIRVNDEANKVTDAEAHVDMNNNGKIIVVWEDFRDDSFPLGTYDIYGQCFRFKVSDSTFVEVGNNVPVNSNYLANANGATQASVAINDDSICVFAWKDLDDITGFQSCIFAAIDTFPIATVVNDYFKPFGGWKSPNGACVLVQNGPQGACVNVWLHPDVDAGDTTFVIVCTDDPLASYGRYIVMNYSLDTLISNIVGQVEMNGSEHHSVSMNKRGRFVITWHHLKGLGDNEIYAAKHDIGGLPSGSYFRVDNASGGISTTYPAVAINEEDQYCIVWWDERRGVSDYYRCYTWDDGAVSCEELLNDIPNIDGAYYIPEITATNTWLEIDTTKYTLAWNIDYHGWSKETFSASAYCYQHSIFDEVKILFADSEDTLVYNYGTQADDINDGVVLTYQTPYLGFGQYPSFDYEMRYATVEAFLDTGNIYLTWYKNYSDSTYYDSLICGSDCRQEMILPEDLRGKNISMKIETGSNVDNFTLSRFWWEWTEDQNRK